MLRRCVCDLETSRMGAPYIYDISRLRVNIAAGGAFVNIAAGGAFVNIAAGGAFVNIAAGGAFVNRWAVSCQLIRK